MVDDAAVDTGADEDGALDVVDSGRGSSPRRSSGSSHCIIEANGVPALVSIAGGGGLIQMSSSAPALNVDVDIVVVEFDRADRTAPVWDWSASPSSPSEGPVRSLRLVRSDVGVARPSPPRFSFFTFCGECQNHR